jgi:hypothetical protein
MGRAWRLLLWVLAALLGLVVLAVAAILIIPNTSFGARLIERETASLTGGTVLLQGFAGRFPDRPRIAHIELRDPKGAWLTIDELALDWSPLKLLGGTAQIDRLTASRVAIPRLAEAQPATASSGGSFQLPVHVVLDALHIARVELGAPVTGRSAASRSAFAVMVMGAAANASGCGPGRCRPASVARSPTWPVALPVMSAESKASVAPAADRPASRNVPVAAGLVNGPSRWAWRDSDCQEMSGRGVIAGAWASRSSTADWPVTLTTPWALAVSGPAVTASRVAAAVHGPSVLAVTAMAPRSGRPAMLLTRPCAGSWAWRAADSRAGSMLPAMW